MRKMGIEKIGKIGQRKFLFCQKKALHLFVQLHVWPSASADFCCSKLNPKFLHSYYFRCCKFSPHPKFLLMSTSQLTLEIFFVPFLKAKVSWYFLIVVQLDLEELIRKFCSLIKYLRLDIFLKTVFRERSQDLKYLVRKIQSHLTTEFASICPNKS